jgi:NTE family protein
MDGGVRGLNLDGASSAGVIIALSPSFRAATQQEVEAARARGAQILAITLDGAASDAQGSNVFDPTRMAPVANAGYRQGLALAEEVSKLWNPLPVPAR